MHSNPKSDLTKAKDKISTKDKVSASRILSENALDKILKKAAKIKSCISLESAKEVIQKDPSPLSDITSDEMLTRRLRRRIIEQYINIVPLCLLDPSTEQVCQNNVILKQNLQNYFPNGQKEIDQACYNYLAKIVKALTINLAKKPTATQINSVLTYRGLPLLHTLGLITGDTNEFITSVAAKTYVENKSEIEKVKAAQQKEDIKNCIAISVVNCNGFRKGKLQEDVFKNYTLTEHLGRNSHLKYGEYMQKISDFFGDWPSATSAAFRHYDSGDFKITSP